MDHRVPLGCDCLSCEAVAADALAPVVDQLAAEIAHVHQLRARSEARNVARRAYVEGRWPHRV